MRIGIGTFVRSSANDIGVGKLRSAGQLASVIDYFVGPGVPFRSESVPTASIRPAELDCETRVYWTPDDGVSWRAGRALAFHGDGYVVRFPNSQQPEIVRECELFTRCDLKLPDPSKFLAARITETPYWQQRRSRFVRALVEQRRACAGLTGLLSAGIDLESHQIEVVRRVLHDPVQRYLLADEVGLGKTIEAGVIVRQYVLDNPTEHAVLIIVPAHLVEQWTAELQNRFRLGPLLGDTIHIVTHGADLGGFGSPGLVVVDEAHQVAHWVAAGDGERSWFDTLRTMVADPKVRLLLLSATPTLHSNEVGFQALLHLLDPVVYQHGDLPGFRVRLAQHERIANLYFLFRPDEQGAYLENALDQLVEAFPQDVRLAEMAQSMRPLLAYGADAADPRREALVRAVRSHVSEAYRLHRRLLRNRRADDRVGGLLPGREGLKLWSYEDPAMAHLANLLDEWRCAASVDSGGAAMDYGRILLVFAQASACDPQVLAELIDLRLGEARERPASVSAGEFELVLQTALFDGESSILGRLRDAALAVDPARRLGELVARLTRQFANPAEKLTRAVIFASYPATANKVFAALVDRWPGRVLRHGQAGWQHFCSTPSFRTLVCDATAEEGLNLHGFGTMLVHYDLPWSPSRVEQRIGRLDRYGVATRVRSAVLSVAREPYSLACADYLDCGYRVFERSIAALQYLTARDLEALYPAVLADGPEAVHAAAERLGGDSGVVEQALSEIQALDQLDAVEVPLGHENFSEALSEADIEQQAEWREATDDWVANALQFARRDQGGADGGVRRYQFLRPVGAGGPSTLMPIGRLIRQFRHVIDTGAENSNPAKQSTYPLTFDRGRAQRERVALARIGDAFINALAAYVDWDDRGVVSAMWRYRPKLRCAKPAEVSFRFEFVVECPTEEAVGMLPPGVLGAANTICRQADWLFPPFTISVWLDQDLEPIAADSSKSVVLAEGYSNKLGIEGGRDFNLNSERWAALDATFPRSDWTRWVDRARVTAEEVVRGMPRWFSSIAERLGAARQAETDRAAQAASRLAFLTGAHKEQEAVRAAADAAVAAALLRGVGNPSLRLDSVGAVFLASWHPFGDIDE